MVETTYYTVDMHLSHSVWSIDCDGYFKHKISKQLIEDDIPEESVDMIFENAVEILSQCPNPDCDEKDGRTGIVIGKVQSGKTSNFIALTALAFDNNYGIAFVLGGNKNNLLNQNASRIKEYFKEVPSNKVVVLTTNQNKNLLNPQIIKKFISEGRKVVIVGLKHQKHANKVAEIFNNDFLCNIPTLIIDDEGDQATLNTKPTKDQMSTIYESVVNLKSKINRHCFVSITATPQANILIHTWDKLSPDFGSLVYPGDDYCGLLEFHGEDEEIYVKSIPDDEPDLLDDEGLPKSFYDALSTFFIGGALRRYRGDFKNHAMLIHPSQKKFDHQKVITKVTKVLDDWQEKSQELISGSKDISYKPFLSQLIKSYDCFKKDGVKLPEYIELEPYILQCIIECSPAHLCNSDEDASSNAQFYKLNVFVGGNMVERGITIKGLAVTYIIRRAKGSANVDNTEQRARWFGYKRSFFDVCRVFTTDIIRDDFKAILEHDDDLWDSIERAQKKGIKFKDIPRIFVLASNRLNLTRKNVAKSERYNYSEWSKQDYLMLNKSVSESNDDVIKSFRITYLNQLQSYDFNGVNKHKIVRNLSYFEVLDDLLEKVVFPNNCRFDNAFFRKLGEVLRKSNIIPIVDVIWLRDEAHEERSLYDDGKINQLFQGRNPNQDSPLCYPGDGGMVADNRNNVMQLQVHYVKPKNRPDIDFYASALALYIPLEYAEKMDKLVGQAESEA
jgi:hypothetical protein